MLIRFCVTIRPTPSPGWGPRGQGPSKIRQGPGKNNWTVHARTWRGYRLYGPRMGPIHNFSLVTGSDTSHPRHHFVEAHSAKLLHGVSAASVLALFHRWSGPAVPSASINVRRIRHRGSDCQAGLHSQTMSHFPGWRLRTDCGLHRSLSNSGPVASDRMFTSTPNTNQTMCSVLDQFVSAEWPRSTECTN